MTFKLQGADLNKNPYVGADEVELKKSLVKLANSRYCYVNLKTKEVESSHVFRRAYEWIKGFFGGNDLCNQKLAAFYLMRQVNLMAEAAPLHSDVIDVIKTITQNLNIFPKNQSSSEEKEEKASITRFFHMIFKQIPEEKSEVDNDIRNYYILNKSELSKYIDDNEVNNFFTSKVFKPSKRDHSDKQQIQSLPQPEKVQEPRVVLPVFTSDQQQTIAEKEEGEKSLEDSQSEMSEQFEQDNLNEEENLLLQDKETLIPTLPLEQEEIILEKEREKSLEDSLSEQSEQFEQNTLKEEENLPLQDKETSIPAPLLEQKETIVEKEEEKSLEDSLPEQSEQSEQDTLKKEENLLLQDKETSSLTPLLEQKETPPEDETEKSLEGSFSELSGQPEEGPKMDELEIQEPVSIPTTRTLPIPVKVEAAPPSSTKPWIGLVATLVGGVVLGRYFGTSSEGLISPGTALIHTGSLLTRPPVIPGGLGTSSAATVFPISTLAEHSFVLLPNITNDEQIVSNLEKNRLAEVRKHKNLPKIRRPKPKMVHDVTPEKLANFGGLLRDSKEPTQDEVKKPTQQHDPKDYYTAKIASLIGGLTLTAFAIVQSFFSTTKDPISDDHVITELKPGVLDEAKKTTSETQSVNERKAILPKKIKSKIPSLKEINSKRLGFINADANLYLSDYEGGDYPDNLAFLLPYLKYKFESNPQLLSSKSPEQGSLVQLLEDFQQRCTLLSKIYKRDVQSIDTQAKSLAGEVTQMKPGARLLINGGWVKARSKQEISGHAVLYIVEKSHDGSYSFGVINTGAGINYHAQLVTENKMKYKSLFWLHKIPPENLNVHFFRALREIITLAHTTDGQPYNNSAEDIYNRILPPLGGVRDVERENQEEWITPQRSGTCSWKSLLKLLQSETTEYKKFNFDLRKDSLQAYFEEKLNSANNDEIQLLRLATENFSRMVTKSFKEGLINPSELQEAELLCSRIIKKISKIETSFRQLIYPLIRSARSLTPSLPPLPQAIPKLHGISSVSKPITSIKFSQKNLPLTAERFNAVAQETLNICHEYLAMKDSEGAIRTIKDFINCVPLNSLGPNGYWSSLAENGTSEALNESMKLLLEFFELNLLAIFQLPESIRVVPDYEASLGILLTYNHRLGELISKEQFASLHPPFSWNRDLYNIINDDSLLERFSECYLFDEQSKLPKLFSNNLYFNSEDGKCTDPILGEIIKSAEFRNQLADEFPDYVNYDDKSLLKAVFPLVVNHEQRLFPLWYHTLARQSFLFSQVNDSIYTLVKPLDADFDSKMIRSKDPWELTLQTKSAFGTINCLIESIIKKSYSFSRFSEHYSSDLFQYFKGYRSNFFDKFIHDEIDLEAAPYQASEITAKGKWSASQMREIANMLSNRELFIPQFISYMKKHPDMFINQEMQELLYYVFSNKQMLKVSFKEFPSAENDFKEMFSDKINLYVNLKNVKPALFMLFLAESINPCLSSDFNFSISEKMALVAEGISDDVYIGKKTKGLALAYYIVSYFSKKQFPFEESKKLISAYFYIKTYGYNESQAPPYANQMIKEVINRCSTSLDLNSPSDQLEIVKNIAQLVLKKADGDWKGSYPVFSDKQSGFKIDLETFTITQGSNLVGALPDHILSNPDFNKLFGGKKFLITIPSPDVYQLSLENTDNNEENYRLFFEEKKGKKHLVIEKKIDDAWYTHFSASEKFEEALPNALVREKTLWGSSKIGKIVIFKQDKKIAEITKSSDKWKVTSINPSLLNPGMLLELQDVYTDANVNYPFLSSFQGKDSVFVWGDERIEFPRINISFQRDKDNKLHFSENKSLILLEKQITPVTLPFYRGSLALEDKKGVRHFLLPRTPLTVVDGSISRYMIAKHNEETNEGRYFKLKEEEGRLVGTTPEENLYLVFLHLAHKNYAEAFRLLNPIYSGNPKGYSSTEHEVAEWIADLLTTSGDYSPQADALRLAVDQFFSDNDQISIETNFSKYLGERAHTKTFRLGKKEEAKLRKTNPFGSGTNVFESVLTEPINQKNAAVEIANKIYSQEIEQLNTKAPFLYLEGEKTLITYWKEFCTDATSNDTNIRSSVVQKLQMLKMDKNPLRDSLIWIATHASDEQRSELATHTDKVNKLSIQIKELFKSNNASVRQARVKLKEYCKEMVQTYIDFSIPKTTIPATTTESLKIQEKTFSFKTPVLLKEEVKKEAKKDKVKKIGNFTVSKEFKFQFENTIDLLNSVGIVLGETLGNYVPQAINTQLQPLANVFRKRSESLSQDNKMREQEILTLLHKKPDNIIEAAKYQLELIGKRKKELFLEDLTIPFLQNDTSFLHKQNPFLTEEDIVKLSDLFTHYLIQATEIQYLGNIADIAEKALLAEGEAYDNEILNLDAALREKRNYDPLTNRTLLVVEYYKEVRLRANQVELINEMTLSKAKEPLKLISQLIMDSGKSNIILPLSSPGKHIPPKQQTNTEQQLQVHIQLEVVEESDNFFGLQRKVLPIVFGNIFSNNYWGSLEITRTVDTLLSERKDELQNYDSSKSFFSKEFLLTNDVAPGKSLAQDLGYKLFQKGTMPVTTCALQIYPDQDPSMRLIVLSPNEVVFLNKIIRIREFIEKPEIDNKIKEAIEEKLIAKGYSEEGIAHEIDKYEKEQIREINLEFSDWKEIMLSLTTDFPEMQTFINNISSDQFIETLFGKKECELILVDPFVKGGAVKGREDILNNPKFVELTTQAKIYNGVVDIFTEQEKAYLKKWVEEEGGQRFLAMLTNIIGSRQDAIERFKNSYLAQLIANTA